MQIQLILNQLQRRWGGCETVLYGFTRVQIHTIQCKMFRRTIAQTILQQMLFHGISNHLILESLSELVNTTLKIA